jgi:hypothetical protein
MLTWFLRTQDFDDVDATKSVADQNNKLKCQVLTQQIESRYKLNLQVKAITLMGYCNMYIVISLLNITKHTGQHSWLFK